METINMVHAVTAITVMPLYLARDEGMFGKYGLNVNISYVQSGSQPTATLLSGETQIFYGTGEGVTSKLAGADVTYVTQLTKPTPWQMFSHKDVTNVEQLRGKKIGSPGGLGTSGRSALLFMLAKHGLTPNDVSIVQTGNGAQGLAALIAHGVDATMVASDVVEAQKQPDLHSLGVARDDGWQFVSGSGLVQRSYLASHRDALVRFIQAQIEGAAEYHKNPDAAKKSFAQAARLTDQSVIDGNYESYLAEFLRVPAMNDQSVQAELDSLGDTVPNAKNAKPAQFYDNSLVSELQSNGFIDKVWAGVTT
ncbi:MAG TPA: ABC transporter substrate-binding protein [Chloroflexota bacterium]